MHKSLAVHLIKLDIGGDVRQKSAAGRSTY